MDSPTIQKSLRHSKYIGQYGEFVVCNMLSRSGFEVMHVNHVGIDVVASRHDVGRIEISVKSRTRHPVNKATQCVNLFDAGKKEVLERVCVEFGIEPWVGVYVETVQSGDLYLTRLRHYVEVLGTPKDIGKMTFGMTMAHRARYATDKDVLHCHMDISFPRWWPLPGEPLNLATQGTAED